jgi:hypothetical protein
MYAVTPCISARDCFQDLNPLPHRHKATTLPLRQGAPSIQYGDEIKITSANKEKNIYPIRAGLFLKYVSQMLQKQKK